MKKIQIVLNAILSKDIFEYILVDRDLKVAESSDGIAKYLDEELKRGDDVIEHMPELVGHEKDLEAVYDDHLYSFTFESVYKNGHYVSISIDHYDRDLSLLLIHDITEVMESKRRLLQYSNETTLLYSALQKIIDNQNTLLFVTNDDNIEFANQRFIEYFNAQDIDDIKRKGLRLYHYFEQDLKSYDELYHLTNDGEKQISIDKDTFILQATLIESRHKLFTLSKVTALSDAKQQLEDEVQLDALTGAYRKKYFDKRVEKELSTEMSCALVVSDIDDFKRINDEYGHQVGDRVLQEFTSLIKKELGEKDIFARWGGEEFLILLKSERSEETIRRVEAMRKGIEGFAFDTIDHLTASFGVAWYRHDDDSSSLLNRADKALYKAKTSGKNKIIVNAPYKASLESDVS